MKTIFCAGLESSGNRWARSVLAQHPELNVTEDSFPSGDGTERHYPIPPKETDVVVLIVRDRTCQETSVLRNGYNNHSPENFHPTQNLDQLKALSQSHPVVFFSYETALVFRQDYWDWIFNQIGVEPIPVKLEYQDGNSKYFNHDYRL
jgi:hypothetical protein